MNYSILNTINFFIISVLLFTGTSCKEKLSRAKIKNMKWTDIALIKLSVLFFTLMLAKLCPNILSLEWYAYLILFVFFAIIPCMKVFKK